MKKGEEREGGCEGERDGASERRRDGEREGGKEDGNPSEAE